MDKISINKDVLPKFCWLFELKSRSSNDEFEILSKGTQMKEK